MTIAIILALLLGGTSYVAEKSQPGDFFYPVKTEVNEKIVDLIAIRAKTDAEWQARLAEKRLEEAEKLAAEGKFNAEIKAKIEAKFDEHADRVEKRIEDFKAKSELANQADISSKFEVSLKAHEAILQKLSAEDVDLGDTLSSLRAKVTVQAGKAEENRADSDDKISSEMGPDVQSAAEGKMKAAQNKIDEVKKFIELMKEKIGADAVVRAQATIGDADKLMNDGKMRMDANEYGSAFRIFQNAEQFAQEAKLLIQASEKLKIDFDVKSSLRAKEADENEMKDAEKESQRRMEEDNAKKREIQSSSSVKIEI